MVEQSGPGPVGGVMPTVPGGVDAVQAVPLTGGRPGRFRRTPRTARDGAGEPAADWRWVEEWRRGGEPVPWGPGLFLATFAGLIIGCAV